MERKNLFKKGDLVWAKIRGYPWWPGIVQSSKVKIGSNKEEINKEIKVLVNFLGDNTHAEIPLQKIENYEKKYEEFSKTKKKNLQKAILLANKLVKGENINDSNNKPAIDKIKRVKSIQKNNDNQACFIKPNSLDDISDKKQLLSKNSLIKDKRYREKSGKKYREFIKVLKKKSSKKEETQELECDNPSSTFNTHLEENLFTNVKKPEEMNSNLSIRSSESVFDFKKEIENLIFYRVNSPASSTKNILSKLDLVRKKLDENIQNRFYEVKQIISYRQLLNEVVPLLKNFLNHHNTEVTKKSNEIISMIKDKVFSLLFNRTEKFEELIFDFDTENYDIVELFKLLDNYFSKPTIYNLEKACVLSDNLMYKNSNESSSLNDFSSDAPQDYLIDCLFKKERKKSKLNIVPLLNNQIYELLKDYIIYDTVDCDEFIDNLRSIITTNINTNCVPDSKKILRKNICIQLLNIFEKMMINFDVSLLKKLVISIEYKIRQCDPEMGVMYQDGIKTFFNRIKSIFIGMNTFNEKA